MPTLILTPRFTDDSQALWRAAIAKGWNVERLSSWRIPAELRSRPDPVLYLEGLFGPTLADQLGLQLVKPPQDWLPSLPESWRKRSVHLSTLGEARSMGKRAFVKPPNDKSFAARIYEPAELPPDYDDNMPVLVSEIVRWQLEFRCFILDRTCRTSSIYLRNGELQRQADFCATPAECEEVQAFIDSVLSDRAVHLERTAVIDIGSIEGRGWAIVEQNAAWGSGIYGCDPAEVLEVLRHAAYPAVA